MKPILTLGTLARTTALVQNLDAHVAALRAGGYNDLAARIASGDCGPREGDAINIRSGLLALRQAASDVDNYSVGDAIADINRAFGLFAPRTPAMEDAYLDRLSAWVAVDDAISAMREQTTSENDVIEAAREYAGSPTARVRVVLRPVESGSSIEVFVDSQSAYYALCENVEECRRAAAHRLRERAKNRPA